MTSENESPCHSGIETPSTRLFRVINPLAKRLGRYPKALTAFWTRSAVPGATKLGVFRTRLTVAIETPAAVATSLIDTAPRFAEAAEPGLSPDGVGPELFRDDGSKGVFTKE